MRAARRRSSGWSGPTGRCRTAWSSRCGFGALTAWRPATPSHRSSWRTSIGASRRSWTPLCPCTRRARRRRRLTLPRRGRERQIQINGQGYRLRGAQVTVCEGFGERVAILQVGRPPAFRVLAVREPPIAMEDEKSVHRTVERAKVRQQACPIWRLTPDHSWRRVERIGIKRTAARNEASFRESRISLASSDSNHLVQAC